ncbi:hypothetical protein JHK82_052003 [Glycine max]|uniref:Uncharacterized protein n=2 Tax=Glycine subgen. Soja TaxID=1462606 RepID=A0A0R0F6G3_SOYBN|nr:hypothetical protein JHK85_052693 [Glycine max]KAG5093225.1 hypothetical protein JHK82_052003 [Glycine max]KAH1156806.1 hypothetical protein GYH30_051554 [Glycine max]KRH01830.1 hypothetical protein GLYMA_18G301400v4 [Glycine max]RZB54369.1 hypothetical protein D0Y65_050001 [Glycine soja]
MLSKKRCVTPHPMRQPLTPDALFYVSWGIICYVSNSPVNHTHHQLLYANHMDSYEFIQLVGFSSSLS